MLNIVNLTSLCVISMDKFSRVASALLNLSRRKGRGRGGRREGRREEKKRRSEIDRLGSLRGAASLS